MADIRRWLRQLTSACQCCAQGKDAARAVGQQRCCAVDQCCEQRLSRRTIVDAGSAPTGRLAPPPESVGRCRARLLTGLVGCLSCVEPDFVDDDSAASGEALPRHIIGLAAARNGHC